MKKQAEVQYMAFHCTHNISQLERAILFTAFPPHSPLHLMFASCLSPSLFPFLLPPISPQLFFFFNLFLLPRYFLLCLLLRYARRWGDACSCAAFKLYFLHSFSTSEGQKGFCKLPLICFLSPLIANELVRMVRHLWFIPAKPTNKSSTL